MRIPAEPPAMIGLARNHYPLEGSNMRHHIRFLVGIVIVILGTSALVGCASSNGGSSQASMDAIAPDLEAIAAQSRALSEAYIEGDIDALVNIYRSDGIAAPAGMDFVRGHKDLHDLWTLQDGVKVVRHKAIPTELKVDGDHAYDWGYYEGQTTKDGELREPFRGTYVIVWSRGSDGVWRIAVDMWAALRG